MPRSCPRFMLVSALLLCLLTTTSAAPRTRAQDATEITILFDTHFHGYLTNPSDTAVTFAHYAALVRQRRESAGGALFLGAGDDLGGSPMSSVFKGAQMVEAFNAAGLDADTFGNHDFDYGPDNLVEQVRASKFPWVSANVTDRRTGDVFAAEAGAKRYVITNVAGVRVGLTGASWQFLSATSAGPNVEVQDAAAALATVVPQMRAAGAEVVIVMAHLCGPDSRAVAAAVSGIDAIVGDHCGERVSQPDMVNGAIIARRGDEYDALGELTLRIQDGRVAGFTYRDHDITTDLPQHDGAAAVLADYTTRLEAELTAPVGATSVVLDARNSTVRAREAPLGNYIADVLRDWGQADVAVINGGGIRGNKEYPAGTLTRGDVLTILPFNNTGVLLRISGAGLRAALENGVGMLPALAGRFPQVSGMSFRFDPEAEPGARVLSVTVGGAPLDPERAYTLVTNDFMANGGDGYDAFQAAEVVVPAQAGPLLSDLLAAAIARDGVIAPMEEGRIRVGHGE